MEDKGHSVDLLREIRFHPTGVYSKVVAKSATCNYTLMCMAGGTDIDTHTSTKNGCVYVLKGRGMFRLFDQEIPMEEGVCIFMPANAPHSLRADEDLAFFLCLSA